MTFPTLRLLSTSVLNPFQAGTHTKLWGRVYKNNDVQMDCMFLENKYIGWTLCITKLSIWVQKKFGGKRSNSLSFNVSYKRFGLLDVSAGIQTIMTGNSLGKLCTDNNLLLNVKKNKELSVELRKMRQRYITLSPSVKRKRSRWAILASRELLSWRTCHAHHTYPPWSKDIALYALVDRNWSKLFCTSR